MKVTFTQPVASIDQCYMPGKEYEIDDREADLLIDAGQAAAVDKAYKPKPKPERVTMDAKASTPAEGINAVTAPAAATNNALTTDAAPVKQITEHKAGPTAVELAKKGGK